MKNQLLNALARRDLVIVGWRDPLEQAHLVMTGAEVRHLPVVDERGEIVGIISDRDFQRAMQIDQADFLSGKSPQAEFDPNAVVRDYMSWPVAAIDEGSSVADAARAMVEGKISALLVTRESYAAGIVTSEDLLRELVERHESAVDDFAGTVKARLYDSPIGQIAQTLANIGV